MKIIISGILFLFTFVTVSSAQTCGFGCLGLAGAFGGVSIQNYKPDGLNKHLFNTFDSDNFDVKEETFTKTFGYRVGANLFQARFNGFFTSAKVFYQFLTEEQNLESTNEGNFVDHEMKFRFDYWGSMINIGIPVFESLDWKIIEGGISFHRVVFENNTFTNNELTEEEKFENDETIIGYSLGSGLIVHLVKDYVSLEGTFTYNLVEIENLFDESGNRLIRDEENGFLVKNGGVTGTVQLNVSFPL